MISPFARLFRSATIVSAFAITLASPAIAQQADVANYPTKPVRIIIPFAPGSATDTITRLAAQQLSEQMGQSFVVDNVGGAGGVTGTGQVARAAPDGYTLLAGSGAAITVNPYLIDNLPYDSVKDFSTISTMGDSPMVVAVPKDSPIKSLKDLVETAKAKPGALKYGSGGTGSAAHIAAEIFKWKTGTNLLHVPYKGVAAAVPDLVAGRLDAIFGSYPSVQALHASGDVRVLAVAARERSPLVPGAPTAAEEGVKDYVLSTWNGLMAPANTPRPILEKLNAALNKILRDPEVVKRLAAAGSYPIPGTIDEFTARIKNELVEMEGLTKVAKIRE